jgi:hypothetical protein
MRRPNHLFLAVIVAAGVGVGCGKDFPDLCEQTPELPECALECNPSPSVPDTCPLGFHCQPDGQCGYQCTPTGGECGTGNRCTVDGRCVPEDQCIGLECQQVDCPSGGSTTISGTVYAPNGTLPLYNVTVYVPNAPIAPFPAGLACDQCDRVLSGDPLVQTVTDTAGRFTLVDVPAGSNIPVVFQVGRWRRQITIPSVGECVDTPLAAADSRLPRNQSEGDIPRIALSTGGADALECLLRKIGLDDSEFTNPGGGGRVHLFAGEDGTPRYDGSLGGADFPDAQELWADVGSLSAYDVTLLSCEGAQNPNTKPQASRDALKAYTDMGGRAFASHWHNVWLELGPPPWDTILDRVDHPDLNQIDALVNTGFPRGGDLAQWLVNVMASTTLGTIRIDAAQHTVRAIDENMAEKWIYLDTTGNGDPTVQYMAFTTPVEQPQAARCGKVVFSDVHVASGDDSAGGLEFPSGGCTSNVNMMSPQEKVLAFMIFDISACIPDVIE